MFSSLASPPDGPSYTPKSFAGLVLWCRSDLGITIGTGVSQWSDQSGSGNHLVQGTAGNQPAYATNGRNGKPELRFDGAGDTLKASTFTLNQGFSVVASFRMIALGVSGVNDVVWDGNTLLATALIIDSTPQAIINAGSAVTFAGAVASPSAEVVSASYNGASSLIRRIASGVGSSVQLATGNAGAGAAAGFAIGASGTGTRSTNVAFQQVAVYNRVLLTKEFRALEVYMRGWSAI